MDEDGTSQDLKHGIKLFGKRISFHDKPLKDEDKDEDEQRLQKRPENIIPCPRCKSMETKFCYFNNYNVNQPRHFCKGCERYWTAGGALRNVPVGAGRRKAKPLCRNSIIGMQENCVYHASPAALHQFQIDGLVEEWKVTAGHGSFHQAFPVKRRRDGHGGQLC